MIDDDLRHLDQALIGQQATERTITRLWARPPVVPVRLPEPVLAATLSASLAQVTRGIPLAAPIVMPAALSSQAVAAQLPDRLTHFVRRPIALVDHSGVTEVLAGTPHCGGAIKVLSRIDFANLRKPIVVISGAFSSQALPATRPRAVAIRAMPEVRSRPVPQVSASRVLTTTKAIRLTMRAQATAAESPLSGSRALASVAVPVTPITLAAPAPAISPTRLIVRPPEPMLVIERDGVDRALVKAAQAVSIADERSASERADPAEAERALQDRAATERHRRIEEACRILRDSRRRPYQLLGKVVVPDLAVLDEAERAIVGELGFDEREVAAALFQRARRDQVQDEQLRIAALEPVLATPLVDVSELEAAARSPAGNKRLAVLALVGRQREATTREWIATGRLNQSGNASPRKTWPTKQKENARRSTTRQQATVLPSNQEH